VLPTTAPSMAPAVDRPAAGREASNARAIGIDLEEVRPLRIDISARVLTPAERTAIAHLEGETLALEILRRFSLKEAFYKAANRFLDRTISFQELEIESIDPDGRVHFAGRLLEETGWQTEGWLAPAPAGHILTTVAIK
jgi:phosphopantetheine--protein transferase-like protein